METLIRQNQKEMLEIKIITNNELISRLDRAEEIITEIEVR